MKNLLMLVVVLCLSTIVLADSDMNNTPQAKIQNLKQQISELQKTAELQKTEIERLKIMQGKWEYCTLEYVDFTSIHKTAFICFPVDAIPDINSVTKKYESDSILNTATRADILNTFGNCGWELVTITEHTGRDILVTHYFFKRHK